MQPLSLQKHVKAAQKAGVDVRLPVYSSRGSPPPGLVEEEARAFLPLLTEICLTSSPASH